MKGSFAVLCLPLLLGAAAVAHATDVTIDFDDTKSSTSNTQLLSSAPYGAVTNLNIGGRNAVQTGGTADNEFLYVALPKDSFKGAKGLWAVVDYYDQGGVDLSGAGTADTFQFHYDAAGTDTTASEAAVQKHNTNKWLQHVYSMPGFDLQELGPGGADIWIDDNADGPEIISKIRITDEDPTLTHFHHTNPAQPVKIDDVISPGEWDDTPTAVLNQQGQDAYGGANWTGPDDYSGNYYYKWDESGLYVRGDVTDSTPRYNDATGDLAWEGDGVQIYLGLDWSDPTHSTYLDGTDFNIYVGLGNTPMWGLESGSAHTVVNWGAIPLDGATPNLAIHNTTTPVGYQFELFIPWQKLLDAESNTTTKITQGQKIGWFMFGNASKHATYAGDGTPSNQEVAMAPFSRTSPSSTPSSWSTTVLEPAPPTTTPPTAGP
jgi:hypothetical protein